MNDDGARTRLLAILQEKSVRHGTFTLASGATSDLYIDARRTTSDPEAALLLGRIGWQIVKKTAAANHASVDGIGGLTMGADWMALSIAIAARLEDPSSRLKAFSVRKSVKGHGLQRRIEGNFAKHQSVVVVDDVITTGGSTLQAIEAIEQEGGRIAFVVVFVDREEGGRQAIEKKGYRVTPIFRRADFRLEAPGGQPQSST